MAVWLATQLACLYGGVHVACVCMPITYALRAHDASCVHAQTFLMQPAAGLPQGNPELEAVWKLLQFSWHRHYQGLWQALQGYPWSPQLQPLVESLTIKTREHLMDLISTAYATVTPSKVAMLCGLTEAEALSGGWVPALGIEHPCSVGQPVRAELLEFTTCIGWRSLPPPLFFFAACQAQGWPYDAGTGMLQVSPKAAAKPKQEGHANLQHMAEYMGQLES